MYFVEKRKFFDMLIVSIIILFPSFNTLCAVSIALFDRSNLKAENSKRIREGHHDTEITQKKISYKQQFVEYFDEICNLNYSEGFHTSHSVYSIQRYRKRNCAERFIYFICPFSAFAYVFVNYTICAELKG